MRHERIEIKATFASANRHALTLKTFKSLTFVNLLVDAPTVDVVVSGPQVSESEDNLS